MDDYLDALERQLSQLTDRGAHRGLRARLSRDARSSGSLLGGDRGGSGRNPGSDRGGRPPRRRTEALVIASAVLVTVAVIAVILSAGVGTGGNSPSSDHVPVAHQRTHPRTPTHPPAKQSSSSTTTTTAAASTPSTGSPAGPVPQGFGPQSFTAIGELTWWLLGQAPCSSPPCTSIVRTDDGGRTFVGIPAPRTDGVSQLRFADSQDGFAYGPQLWVTHDAGQTWAQADITGQVTDVEISGGYVYAVVNNGNGTGRLIRAPIGGGPWTPLTGAGSAFGGLWAHGSDVLVEGATKPGIANQLLVSHDSGASFNAYAVPPSVACHFEEQASPVIWAHCATGMMSGVWRSTSDGASWTASPSSSGLPEMPNSAAFGSASSTTAVVGYRQLYRTTDGGATWTRVAGPPGITWWQYIGFTDDTHGVALGYVGSETPAHERLYYTTDGGQSYHLVTVS